MPAILEMISSVCRLFQASATNFACLRKSVSTFARKCSKEARNRQKTAQDSRRRIVGDLLGSIATELLRSDIRGVAVLFHNDIGKHFSSHLINCGLTEKRKRFRDRNRRDAIVCWER